MPLMTSSPWASLLAGTAIFIALAAVVRSNTQEPGPNPQEYEWQPPPLAQQENDDPLIDALRKKASGVYTSLPLKFISVATKRVRSGSRRSADDPWTAAVFHTGWEARKMLESPLYETREQALRALSSMLANTKLGEYEWTECPAIGISSESSEAALVQEIKRLACIVHRHHTPSHFSVALKRLQHGRRKDASDSWAAGLWAGRHEGFVEEFMLAGQLGQFNGQTRVEALTRLKGKLEGQRC